MRKALLLLILFLSPPAAVLYSADFSLPAPDHGRTLTELGSLLFLGAVDSAIHHGNCFPYQESAGTDYRYDSFWEGVKDKFSGNGIRFDNNSRTTNFGHAFAGAFYYSIARSNHLSSLHSLLYSAGAFFVWESLVEYREVFSLNDAIITPLGGFAIGEPLYQFSEHFYGAENSFLNDFFALFFNPPAAFNRWLDSKKDKHRLDKLSSQRAVFLFSLSGGIFDFDQILTFSQERELQFTNLSLRGDLYNIRHFLEPGKKSAYYTDTLYSHLSLDATFVNHEHASGTFRAMTAYAGYLYKNIRSLGNVKTGYEFFVGPSIGLESNIKSQFYKDWYIALNVLGIYSEAHFYFSGYHLKLTGGLGGDFSMVKPLAAEHFQKTYNIADAQSVFKDHLYYYGVGYHAGISGEIENDSFIISLSALFFQIFSVNGKDNYQEEIKEEIHFRETMLKSQLEAGYKLGGNLSILLGSGVYIRQSEIDGVTLCVNALSYYLKTQWLF